MCVYVDCDVCRKKDFLQMRLCEVLDDIPHIKVSVFEVLNMDITIFS
jgi:hypothetical protein